MSFKTENHPPFDFFDKVYFINLDKRVDRRNEVIIELDKHGINAERFSAVELGLNESNEMTKNGAAIWDIKVLPHYTQDQLNRKVRSQRSCTLSHLQIVKEAKSNGFKNVLIFEDDVVFNDEVDFTASITNALKELKTKNWDMFVLGCNPRTTFNKDGKYLARLGGFYNAHAVALNSQCYDKVLNLNFKTSIVIDQYYFGLCVDKIVSAYTPIVPLAFQRDSFSDVEEYFYGTKSIQLDAYRRFLL